LKETKHHGEPHVVWILLEKSHQETSCLISLEKGYGKISEVGFPTKMRKEQGEPSKDGLTPKWWESKINGGALKMGDLLPWYLW